MSIIYHSWSHFSVEDYSQYANSSWPSAQWFNCIVDRKFYDTEFFESLPKIFIFHLNVQELFFEEHIVLLLKYNSHGEVFLLCHYGFGSWQAMIKRVFVVIAFWWKLQHYSYCSMIQPRAIQKFKNKPSASQLHSDGTKNRIFKI